MVFYLGVTDNKWYNFLSRENLEDINFWQPGGNKKFRVLSPGAPFIFKLRSPANAIGGIGFFSSHTFLPVSMAWDVFGKGNGCNSLTDLQNVIFSLRKDKTESNPQIGCIVLTNPIFFKKEDWIPTPSDWGSGIIQGKSYSTDTEFGQSLWSKIEKLLQKYLYETNNEEASQLTLGDEGAAMYGKPLLTKVRLGQGAFRVLVTDAYDRKCAISGEKTLPVLDAAHIQPYVESGSHLIANALLLRSDLHKLFDSGYLTITSDFKIEISRKIKEEYQNGKEYYKFHGENILTLPRRVEDKPGSRFIEWHNQNIYKG